MFQRYPPTYLAMHINIHIDIMYIVTTYYLYLYIFMSCHGIVWLRWFEKTCAANHHGSVQKLRFVFQNRFIRYKVCCCYFPRFEAEDRKRCSIPFTLQLRMVRVRQPGDVWSGCWSDFQGFTKKHHMSWGFLNGFVYGFVVSRCSRNREASFWAIVWVCLFFRGLKGQGDVRRWWVGLGDEVRSCGFW